MSTQFNCQKYFYFKLFSLFKQFYLTHRSSATILGQSEPGSNSNEGLHRIPKASASLEPHHQIV